jgi:hypothetical protein
MEESEATLLSSKENASELARVMEHIALSYQAAQRAFTSPAIMAPHEFIQKRMEEIERGREKIATLVGDELKATDLVVKRLAEIEEQGQKQILSDYS